MAGERTVKVIILGDATSLQSALGRADASVEGFGATTAGTLQTSNVFLDQHGQALSKAEQHYANLQLSSKELQTAERDVAKEGRSVAMAFGSLGEQGGKAFERISALGGVMGSSGALGLGIGAALIGGGLLVGIGKSEIDNADRNAVAQSGLGQAFESQGKNLRDYQGQIDSFLSKNSRFIQDQYDAKDGIAALTRAGFDWNTTQRLMNDALDLAAIKGVSYSAAVDDLVRAHSGDARALRDLGIAQKDIEDPTKALADAEKQVAKATDEHSAAVRALTEWEARHSDRAKLTAADLMHEQDLKDKVTKSTRDLTNANNDLGGAQAAVKDKGDKFNATLDLLESKTKNGRDRTSDLKQSENDLGAAWDKLSNDNGPALEGMLANLLTGTDDFLKALGDQKKWDAINGFLVGAAKNAKGLADAIQAGVHAGGPGPVNSTGVAANPNGPYGPGSAGNAGGATIPVGPAYPTSLSGMFPGTDPHLAALQAIARNTAPAPVVGLPAQVALLNGLASAARMRGFNTTSV